MAETVGDLIKRLTDYYDPSEPIVSVFWTRGDVQDEIDNHGGSLKVSNSLAETILSKFEFGDYTWNAVNEDWAEAINGELDEFRCENCYGYYDKQDLVDVDGDRTCNECGEEPDAPLYSAGEQVENA